MSIPMDDNLKKNSTSSTKEWETEKVEYSSENVQLILQEALLKGSIETVENIVKKSFSEYRNLEEEINQNSTINKLENNGRKNQTLKKCKEIAKFLLFKGIDLNFPNSSYSLLLHFVMMNDDEETFRYLLQKGKNYDLHSLGPEKQTILHYAVYENKKNFIKHLINFGIDINIGDHENKTALHYAVRKKNLEMVNYLLSLGADVDKKMNGSGYTVLHIAVVMKNKEIIDILLKSGADIKAKCETAPRTERRSYEKYYESSMLNFVCGRSVLRRQLLFRGINFPSVCPETKRGRERIVFDKEMIEFLLNRGAETEVYDFSFDEVSATPLQRACQVGRLDIVEILLKYGADPYAQDSLERTMIFYATLGSDYRIVDLFLRKNLDINARDKENETPLYFYTSTHLRKYCLVGYKAIFLISMLDYLVDNGADINAKIGTENCTSLLDAACYENPHLIEALLELKADYRAQDEYGTGFLRERLRYVDSFELYGRLSDTVKVFVTFVALTENDLYGPEDCSEFNLEVREALDDFFKKCKLEVEKMKKKSISRVRHVTFHQFLVDDSLKVSKYARNGEIMEILEFGDYKIDFPCYKFLLEKRVERVEELLFIQNLLINFIEKYAKIELPVVIIDKILSYLSVGDLRNFGRQMCFLKRKKNVITLSE